MSGPDRIWAFDYDLSDDDGTWRKWQCWSEDHPTPLNATEYIRRDPAVLAALPEVQAMIAEAVAKEREANDRLAERLSGARRKAEAMIDVMGMKGAAYTTMRALIAVCEDAAAAIRKREEG